MKASKEWGEKKELLRNLLRRDLLGKAKGKQLQALNRTARHWDTAHPELKLRAQPTKGTEVPWEPG